VVRFEEEEHGNVLGVTTEVRLRLADMPACAVTWVCLRARDALRYGNEIVTIEFDEIISEEDGDGGYLVIISTFASG
jgi:hypothetical protein